MAQVYIEDLSKNVGKDVTLKGWLYNRRTKGKLCFLIVRDGTGICQCVLFKGDSDEETFKHADSLPYESALEVTGCVKADERAPGGHELQIKKFRVVSVSEEYPISKQEHGTDFLMNHRHLWLRSRKQWAILRVRSTIIQAIREFFDSRGFINFDAPILTPNACEGTTTLFETEYFDLGKAYLSQSGQLYGEAGAMALGKVYVFGPTFRAEKSKTRRHIMEFWMVEPEVAYITYDELLQLCEDFVCHIVNRVLEKRRDELAVLERNIAKLEAVKPPFPRVTYSQAVEMLKKGGHTFEWGGDFGSPDETYIAEQFDRPVLVTHYPKDIKAFYMKENEQDPRVVNCVDVLAPEGYGEIIGGSQREDNLQILESKINAHSLPMEAFQWFLDLRRYGSVPHGGFGMGLERCVMWICGLDHIREAIPFPRLLYRIYP